MEKPSSQVPGYIYRAAEAYDLAIRSIALPQKGYRNQSFAIELTDGSQVNLILYKNEQAILTMIKNANMVADYVARQNLLVRRTYDSRIMKLVGQPRRHTDGQYIREVRYAALYNFLEGEPIVWEAYTQKHIKLLGRELNKLHRSLQWMPMMFQLPSVARLYVQIIGQMHRYFSHQSIREAMQQKLGLHFKDDNPFRQLAELRHLVQACDNLPEQQVLHMDFVRGNILFHDRPALHISGILDFEKTGRGNVAFDIARTMAFLLVDCKYKSTDQVFKYFLDSGYNKSGQSIFKRTRVLCNGQRYDLLNSLIELFLFYDLYKFLRHNPYEALTANEHFQRTRDILQQRQRITSFI